MYVIYLAIEQLKGVPASCTNLYIFHYAKDSINCRCYTKLLAEKETALDNDDEQRIITNQCYYSFQTNKNNVFVMEYNVNSCLLDLFVNTESMPSVKEKVTKAKCSCLYM